MDGSAYPAARSAAAEIHQVFARACEQLPRDFWDSQSPLPSIEQIEEIVSTGFWASLRREEGMSPKISMAFVPPERASSPLALSRPLALTPHHLTKLAPAVERPSIHLGVWEYDGHLRVWGATMAIPPSCFVAEVVEPGVVVVKRRRSEVGSKFANVAVFRGQDVMMLDESLLRQSTDLPLASALLDPNPRDTTANDRIIVPLALSMQAHGRGGALLIVPAGTSEWTRSIASPITYALSPEYRELADVAHLRPPEPDQAEHTDAIRRLVDLFGGLTAVDGATLITDRFELIAFGAKIVRRADSPSVESVLLAEPVRGSTPVELSPLDLGGTRHLSAAQFVHDQPGALAMVASQDGKFTLFLGDGGTVRAYRIETLLL